MMHFRLSATRHTEISTCKDDYFVLSKKGWIFVQRITIIGSPGAGKSTFARRLGDVTGLEVYHLDRLYWQPGWVETSRALWIKLQEELIERPSWIIDGNYHSTMDIRIQAADTVILLDVPRYLCLWRAIKRVVQFRGKTRPDMGEGCAEKLDLAFLLYIWGFQKRENEAIDRRLKEALQVGKQVIRFSKKAEIDAYLTSLRRHGSQVQMVTADEPSSNKTVN